MIVCVGKEKIEGAKLWSLLLLFVVVVVVAVVAMFCC